MTFQFHIGAIRSYKCAPEALRDIVFQFHIGAIRSLRRAAYLTDIVFLECFNSILVQLEDAPRAAEWN